MKSFKSFLNAPTRDAETIAKHHKVDVSQIHKQLEIGISVEHEHTKDKDVAAEIAKDHLWEDPLYYTKLDKAGL